MLKKVIIGILCFLILAITGLGIYIYTLDWNKHKSIVAHRLSQITGLKAAIDGNLSIELFPKPKFSAGLVKFTHGNSRTPLAEVNNISANVDFLPLLSNQFILSGMTLTGAEISLVTDEKGTRNWGSSTKAGKNKSGNIEVSFNDVKIVESSITFENKQNKNKFTLPKVSASISAPSLKGPYKTSGKFTHNKKEVNFSGSIENNKDLKVKMNINCGVIGSKFSIDGVLGDKPKGTVILEGKSLYETLTTVFGEDSISNKYNESMYVSFTYGKDNEILKLNNFNVKYGNNTIGNGFVNLSKGEKWNISSDIDMSKFDLSLLENIGIDIVNYSNNINEETKLPNVDMDISVKSDNATYKGAAAHKLNMGVTYNDGVINLNRFAVTMPGETTIKSLGKLTTTPKLEYIFENTLESKDIKTFASLFNINLTAKASKENKKSIFGRAQAEFMISGGKDAIKVALSKALIDNTNFSGNLGFVFNEGETHVILQTDLEKILFDKYVDLAYVNDKKQSFEDKLLYQLNLSPWKGKFTTDAAINIKNAVYNNIALENLQFDFVADENNLNIESLSIENFAGSQINLKADIKNPYSNPYFEELTYDIKTANFPGFATNIGLDTGSKDIFKRKTFASQGIINGSMSQLNISSIQKFGDTEISYTGIAANAKDGDLSLNGDIELKANNFTKFAQAIGFSNYKPDLPVTTFTLNAQIVGSFNLFELNNINAHLGTNHIQGIVKVDNTTSKAKILADLNFDNFNINNMFNISKKQEKPLISTTNTFIDKLNLSDEKIDLSYLNNVDFDITANIKQPIWNNQKYADLKTRVMLNDGVINVEKFNIKKDDSVFDVNFILDSKNLAKITGNYNISKYNAPSFGGSIYKIEKAILNSKGSFASNLLSEKAFYDNLSAKGNYSLTNLVMNGWDLDVIKFELEQRKSIKDLEEVIASNLRMGKTLFNKGSGKFEFSKGVFVSDNSVLSSPVENLDMKINVNLGSWLITSDFNIFYNNASFSDVVKFNLSGDVSNPELKININESIERIKEVENRILIENEGIKKQKDGILQSRIDILQKSIDETKQNIERMSLDFIKFKPTTNNKDIVKAYNQLQAKLKEVENNINNLGTALKGQNSEKDLMDIEAKIAKESSKIIYLPKSLEENFIAESKYIFDNSFSKLTWLFNLAQNNSSYYNSLVEVYMKQIELLKTTDEPIAEETVAKLKEDTDKISDNSDKISVLYNRIRDSYLNIIDSSSLIDMKRNNDMAVQALYTMLSYIKQLNDNIVSSIDEFRSVLDIEARDYDTYLLYPPETVDEIDISSPVVKNTNQTKNNAPELEKKNDNIIKDNEIKNNNTTESSILKNKDELKISFNTFANSVASLFNTLKAKNKHDIQPASETGIKSIVNNIPEMNTFVVAEKTIESNLEPVVIAEDIKTNLEPIVIAEDIDTNLEPVVVAEDIDTNLEPVVIAEDIKTNLEPVVVAEDIKTNLEPVVVAEDIDTNLEPVVVAEDIDTNLEPVVIAEDTKTNLEPVVVAEDIKTNLEPVVIAEDIKTNLEPVIVAEDIKTNLEPVVVAEDIKTNLEPVVIAEDTKTNLEPVVVAEDIDIAQKPVVAIDNSIVDKTKLALSDIIYNISQKEEMVLKNIKQQEVAIETENNSNTLKINPVIAMNIGKTDLVDIDIKSSLTSHKRKGFYFKKDATKEEGIKVSIDENTINEDKIKEKLEPQKEKQFLKFFANSNDNFTRNIDVKTSDIVAEYKKELQHKHYVFTNTSTISGSGEVGKYILRSKNEYKPIKNHNKYIFAANNVDKITLSGSVGKKIALSVK